MKKKINRKRNKAITIRLSPDEYKLLQDKVDESGLTQQSFIINAIKGATIASSKELDVQKDISKSFSDLVRQLRGLATNVNQMAHIANGQGIIPSTETLNKTSYEINEFRKECEDIWQLIRLLINQQKHMEL